MTTKRQKRVEGDVVKVDLGDGHHSYGRVLPAPTVAFYAIRASEEVPIREVLGSKILFKCWVMVFAIKKAAWPVVGHASLESELRLEDRFLHRDQLNGNYSVYYRGRIERPATSNEDFALEPAMVWDPNHIEDRLRSHFKGEPCVWLRSFWRPIPGRIS